MVKLTELIRAALPPLLTMSVSAREALSSWRILTLMLLPAR